MPKSKRARVVHLSKVDKKGKEHTVKLFNAIREGLDSFQYCFVFSVENMRNTYLKDVRSEFSDGRLFFGKTKVMAKALGSTPEDECQPGTRLLAPYLAGSVGLLLTNRPPGGVLAHLEAFSKTDFARAGTPAARSFTIPPGVVYSLGGEVAAEDDVPLGHALEPELRKLNVPTSLKKGKVWLENEYVVCEEGAVLDSRQTRLLKLFGVATADFRVDVLAYWSAATNEVKQVKEE